MSSSDTFTNLANGLKNANSMPAGTVTYMADGDYTNVSRAAITKAGAIFRAKNKGKAIIRKAPIDLAANQVEFRDFKLIYDISEQTFVNVRGIECVVAGNICNFASPLRSRQDWFVLRGQGSKMLQNECSGKKNLGNVFLIGTGSAFVPNCTIAGNYIHDNSYVPASGEKTNGAEAIRLGSSETANSIFNTQIFENKIERHQTSDTELITIKSSGNNVYNNEIIDCSNNITVRHGYRNKVINNRITNGGIRIYGKDNIVTDNKMYKNSRNQLRQFTIGNGTVEDDVTGPNEEHARVKNNVIERNEIHNEDAATSDSMILFCLGYGDGALKPINNSIKDNIVTASQGILYNTGTGATWSINSVSNNIGWPTGSAKIGNIPNPVIKDPSLPAPPPTPIPDPVVLTLEERVKKLEERVTALELR